MVPVSTLYDEYIDRPKLTEQKNPVEYIVPPRPSRGVGTIMEITWKIYFLIILNLNLENGCIKTNYCNGSIT